MDDLKKRVIHSSKQRPLTALNKTGSEHHQWVSLKNHLCLQRTLVQNASISLINYKSHSFHKLYDAITKFTPLGQFTVGNFENDSIIILGLEEKAYRKVCDAKVDMGTSLMHFL